MNFEEILNNPNAPIVAGVIAFLILILIIYYIAKKENAEDVAPLEQQILDVTQPEQQQEIVQPIEQAELAPVSQEPQPQTQEIQPADLLPKSNDVTQFEQQFPSGEGETKDKNFLIAGYNIGVNTVGSSLRNANLQLRSDPYIPRQSVGPWNESSIMSSDLTNRKTLEIGS